MQNLNDCKFIGNMTRDPEVKYMPNGDAVVNFSLACNDDYKDKSGEMVKVVNYINFVAFKKAGELIGKYCLKGAKLFASGKMKTRKWQAKDGSDRYSTEIIVQNFEFLSPQGNATQNNTNGNGQAVDTSQPVPQAVAEGFDDDIPF